MAEQVTVWMAADGRAFDTQEAAERHELSISVNHLAERMSVSVLDLLPATARAAARWLLSQYRLLPVVKPDEEDALLCKFETKLADFSSLVEASSAGSMVERDLLLLLKQDKSRVESELISMFRNLITPGADKERTNG